jgi:hypothetical protein
MLYRMKEGKSGNAESLLICLLTQALSALNDCSIGL